MYEEKLVIALSRAYRVVFNEIDKQLGANDLNLSQFGILEALYHKGEQPIAALSQRILAFSGSIEDNVHYLMNQGLVSVNSNQVDITKAGMELMDHVYPVHKVFLKELFKSIPQDLQATLVEELKQLYHIHK